MSYLMCVVPVSPVRAEASHRSEQVTQLLFGEVCELIESTTDFVRIKMLYDDYEGWCQQSQLSELSANNYSNNTLLAADIINKIVINDEEMLIPFGCSLSFLKDNASTIGNLKTKYAGSVFIPSNNFSGEEVIRLSKLFLNTAYQWGGRSVYGIDCSGFTQLVFKCMNIFLLRDASQQATQGDAIGFLMEAKTGDLAFFDNAEGKITHVGILLDQQTIIHASGKVRIDAIDNFGIINKETGKRTHSLRVIKRYA